MLHCVPSDVVQPRFDALLRSSLDRIADVAFQIVLGARILFLGSLGQRNSVNTIVPEYLGCCSNVHSLSVRPFFPDVSSLRSLLSCGSNYSTTQHAFQVPHDNECYQSLVSS